MDATAVIDHHAKLVVVAVGQYDGNWDSLEQARESARELADNLDGNGYRINHRQALLGGECSAIGKLLHEWLLHSAEPDDRLVLFWTGHGHSDSGKFYLITKDSPRIDLSAIDALDTGFLGDLVAKSKAEKILVVLDTCYSGAGADDVAREVSRVLSHRVPVAGREKAVAVIASAHSLELAQEGHFCRILRELLTDPVANRIWSDEDQYIRTDDLARALAQELFRRGIPQNPIYKADGYGHEFVPNPRFRPDMPAEVVETRRERLRRKSLESHFLPASRGIEVGEAGWYFTGRKRLLAELVSWLDQADRGMLIVTGPPGSGKSAVIGRLATLSDPAYRQIAERNAVFAQAPPETIPHPKSIDVALHAKGQTLMDCVRLIARGLDLPFEEAATPKVEHLLRQVASLERRVTVLLDALDEAVPGHPRSIVEKLLLPLSRLQGFRVLLGSRYSPEGTALREDADRHLQLRAQVAIHDLADEPETLDDIAEYVRRRLADSRHRGDAEGIKRVSRSIAKKAEGLFLYARLVARTLMDLQSLGENLPESALDAFVSDIRRRFGDRAQLVDELLESLAWGQGKGLTRRVWPVVAGALSSSGAMYRDEDATWVLQNAGWHVVEAGEGKQAVYRLAHELFVDYYQRSRGQREAHSQIARSLSEGVRGAAWLDVDRYCWRHLASHAARAGVLDQLLEDPGYLAVADPATLLSALPSVSGIQASWIGEIYRRTADRLFTIEPLERMALLHLTACQEHPEINARLQPTLPTAWKCRWAVCSPTAPHLLLSGHESWVDSVAWGELEGRAVLASGGYDGIRLWDAATGRTLGEPLVGHARGVSSLAWGELEGRAVLASGDTCWVALCFVERISGSSDLCGERIM